MRIIAIAGVKRCGKDTIADYLQATYGYKNIKVAATLKDVIKTAFNMSHDQVEGELKDTPDQRWGITPRQAMQFIGTEVFQYKIQELIPEIGRNFWIRQLCTQIASGPQSATYAISDVRFIHEVEELHKMFGSQVFVLKVIRNQDDAPPSDNHASEREWEQIRENMTITNNGTLQDLYSTVDKLVRLMAAVNS